MFVYTTIFLLDEVQDLYLLILLLSEEITYIIG